MYMEEHGSRAAEDPSKTPIFYTYSYPHDQHAAAVEDSGHNPFPEGEYPSGYARPCPPRSFSIIASLSRRLLDAPGQVLPTLSIRNGSWLPLARRGERLSEYNSF